MNEKELRGIAIDALLWKQAFDNIGIYPQKVVGGEGSYEKRSERMEGWNECAMATTHKAVAFYDFLKSLDQHRSTIEDLLLAGEIELSENGGIVTMAVNCNDLFFWGCADAEEFTVEDIPAMQECLKLSPRGALLWCCKKRKMRPQTPAYKVLFTPNEWALLNAAGPMREEEEPPPVAEKENL